MICFFTSDSHLKFFLPQFIFPIVTKQSNPVPLCISNNPCGTFFHDKNGACLLIASYF